MTASAVDLAGARAALNALGRMLDELALTGADETVLDGLLTAMRQVHDGTVGHLAAASGITPASTERHHRQPHLQAA